MGAIINELRAQADFGSATAVDLELVTLAVALPRIVVEALIARGKGHERPERVAARILVEDLGMRSARMAEAGKKRWAGSTKLERQRACSKAGRARWAKWRQARGIEE